MDYLYKIIILLALGFILIELKHLLRPNSPLKLRHQGWEIKRSNSHIEINGRLEIYNPHSRIEVMVPEINVNTILLGGANVNNIKVSKSIKAEHKDEEARADGYWSAYIVKSKKSTYASIKLTFTDNSNVKVSESLENLWIEINWINYGPFGRVMKRDGFVLPIKKKSPIKSSDAYFYKSEGCELLPIQTHLLSSLDDPIKVLSDYTKEIIQKGDVLTIGETPLAIMQNRYIHPENVKPNFLAILLCKAFHPTSSLATACGLQVLIDIIGPSRVIFSWIIGFVLKLLGIKGMFYRLAGNQARLIDDITGSIPPYDQTIVLGPINTEKFCKEASEILGVQVAVVDVNDLGRVKILATSEELNKMQLRNVLRSNPAGNGNEQTPLVLVRPS